MRARMVEAVDAADASGDASARLAAGLWVLRLKTQFDRAEFRSASSTALRDAVRAELRDLLRRAGAVRSRT